MTKEDDQLLSAHSITADQKLTSAQKYALLTVGTQRIAPLLYYEFAITCFSGIGGALGYALRRIAYRPMFRSFGRKTIIGRNVLFRGAKKIAIGDNTVIDDGCVIDARGGNASIEIEDNVMISRNTIIRSRNGEIVISQGADIGCNCMLETDTQLSIGTDVLIAAYCYIAGISTYRYDDKDTPIKYQHRSSKGGIQVDQGTWLGTRSTVLDGASIGTGAVVGAHSMVKETLSDYCVAYGTPAKSRWTR